MVSTFSYGIERMYGVVSTGYSDVEFNQREEESFGYKILLGHQFHRQWYVETGYYKIADVGNEQSMENDFFKADGLYLGALGKASSPMGELFYRLGVARIDVVGYEPLTAEGGCNLGNSTVTQSGDTYCRYDKGVFAGILGLGFDLAVAEKLFVRLDADYIRGGNGLDTGMISLGLRYNFN
ncbi:hypothetical protein BFC17_21025 [Alteromonas lipolytica]|uniref:Outer membrane protein beta-barrel domain-containing protein n=1 Tax=Alteromonas lipolytica TaxID=1856405 RepID=A0A1E8FFA0_9ALTE|nr:hypothetical protein BFC17_21025 [Alteromonas lipolytica]